MLIRHLRRARIARRVTAGVPGRFTFTGRWAARKFGRPGSNVAGGSDRHGQCLDGVRPDRRRSSRRADHRGCRREVHRGRGGAASVIRNTRQIGRWSTVRFLPWCEARIPRIEAADGRGDPVVPSDVDRQFPVRDQESRTPAGILPLLPERRLDQEEPSCGGEGVWPTLPFSDDEMTRILAARDQYAGNVIASKHLSW